MEFLALHFFELLVAYVGVLVAVSHRWRVRLWLLRWRTSDWVTLDLDCIKLRHPPDVSDQVIALRLDSLFRQELAKLAGWFGRPLRKPPTVFLFPTSTMAHRVTGGAGAAIQGWDWVFLPLDLDRDQLRGLARHELVHLHSYWFAGSRPPLMEEGLAKLLQQVVCNWSRGRLPPPELWKWDIQPPSRRWPPLRALLDRHYFYGRRRRAVCYDAAASFSAFLIQRYGWEKYLAFYKRSRPLLFHVRFWLAFGISFGRAEREWRAGQWAVQLPATD